MLQVEDIALCVVSEFDASFLIYESISNHGREHHAEVGARRNPCFTPFVTGKRSDSLPSSKTQVYIPL